MNYTFTYKSEDGTTKIVYNTTGVCLEDILMEFENFLKGSGYHFQGSFQLVKEEDEEEYCEDSFHFEKKE